MNAPVFNQPNWNVGRVYNVAGDLILSESSSREDFLSALSGLKRELSALDRVDPAQRAEFDAELDAIIDEAGHSEPNRERIVGRLERMSEKLRALGGVMSRALDVAKTVSDVAAWAIRFF